MTEPKTIAEWQAAVHELAKDRGWYDGAERTPDTIAAKIALIHSELSEALEELRRDPINLSQYFLVIDGKPEGFVVELADAVIRIHDLCGWLGLNLEEAMRIKHAFNATRSHRHNGKAL